MARTPTIGLEIHVGLKTERKMFCACPNNPSQEPANSNTCAVCLAHPGTLPVPNKQAIEQVIRVGLALGGKIAEHTKFDRKNYFYPDIPKGYQISQYDQPLVSGGSLNGINLTRIHLEEDVGRSLHGSDTFSGDGSTLIDFNRAGVPLMELVTEPEFRSADQVTAFAKELQLILRYLGASDADMEKGQMRIEANVSLDMGTKTELKNINSFRAVHDAVEFEIERQGKALDAGEKIVQETRGWDEIRRVTVSQRSKEDAHDYRYFPDPDIPPFETDSFGLDALQKALPELPKEKRARLVSEYGLFEDQANLLAGDIDLAAYFEQAVSEVREEVPDAAMLPVYNYLTSDLKGLAVELGKPHAALMPPAHLARVVALIAQGKLTSRQAKDLLRLVAERGETPDALIASEGFGAVDVGALESTVKEVLEKNPAAVADWKKGKEASAQFLFGAAMRELRGQADPVVLKEAIQKALSEV
jgi:aspartyl-tRNA(Asn)/glutamyl-tRNA(Gln) amidotransferase subunit B